MPDKLQSQKNMFWFFDRKALLYHYTPNDLAQGQTSDVKIFADDTSLLSFANNTNVPASE